jgi:chaperonin cofactor prefoldin
MIDDIEDDINDYNFLHDRERYDSYHNKIKELEKEKEQLLKEYEDLKNGIIRKKKKDISIQSKLFK